MKWKAQVNRIITLDENYSTTRRVIKADPQEIAGLVKQSNKPEDKFETVLCLPVGENRQGEGGLRTKGYFKVGGIIGENTVIASETKQSPADTLTLNPSLPAGENLSPKAKPLITVVTVVFNGEQFLEETILSVINQTYDNVEYIIIDGGSTDGTLDIIKKYEHVIDYWVSEKDRGIYDAMNKGVSCILGDWYLMLNAGDVLYRDTVIKSIGFPEVHREKVVFGRAFMCFENMLWLRYLEFNEKKLPCHQAIFFPYLLAKNKSYNDSMQISSDSEYIKTIFSAPSFLYEVPIIISRFEMGGVSNYYKNFNQALIHAKEKGSVAMYLKIFIKFLIQKAFTKRCYLRIVLLLHRVKDA